MAAKGLLSFVARWADCVAVTRRNRQVVLIAVALAAPWLGALGALVYGRAAAAGPTVDLLRSQAAADGLAATFRTRGETLVQVAAHAAGMPQIEMMLAQADAATLRDFLRTETGWAPVRAEGRSAVSRHGRIVAAAEDEARAQQIAAWLTMFPGRGARLFALHDALVFAVSATVGTADTSLLLWNEYPAAALAELCKAVEGPVVFRSGSQTLAKVRTGSALDEVLGSAQEPGASATARLSPEETVTVASRLPYRASAAPVVTAFVLALALAVASLWLALGRRT